MQKVRRTLADYDALPEHVKADLIEGELVMAPAPTHWHERLLMRRAMPGLRVDVAAFLAA